MLPVRLRKGRATAGTKFRVSGENRCPVARWNVSVDLMRDRFHERGRNDHPRPGDLPSRVTQTLRAPEYPGRFS